MANRTIIPARALLLSQEIKGIDDDLLAECKKLAHCNDKDFDKHLETIHFLRSDVAHLRAELSKLLEQAVPDTKENRERLSPVRYEGNGSHE